MATEAAVKQLRTKIDKAKEFDKENLITRPSWGEIDLEDGRRDFERVFSLVGHLDIMPVELLPDTPITVITEKLESIIELFTRIDKFSLKSGNNPTNDRNTFTSQLHTRADELFTAAAPWIPFLAYQKGDVARNIQNLTTALTQAEGLVNSTKATLTERGKEIEDIIVKAREASAAAGAAVFTRDFQVAAEKLERDATFWIKVTFGAAVLTLLIAGAMWFWVQSGDQGEIIQKLSTKLVILAVLLTGTIWCGRNYKALKHQATINRHRALSLQTLQAFSAAAADSQTKDAVLLEATRAVFGSVPTGYIDSSGGDSDLKIVEVARSILPKSEK